METQPRTPQAIFHQPQRLIVPLFQRPYVWNRELQWQPLWEDIVRVTERYIDDPTIRHQPHFVGAVVVQQTQNSTGSMQERTVIDGQQRLTTLQIMLDAIHAAFVAVGAAQPAKRLEQLIANDDAFCEAPSDRYKVWPTNRDREAFNEVMAAEIPVDYAALDHRSDRLVKAHEFFCKQAGEWLAAAGDDEVDSRSSALDRTVRELLQMVVIDLNADENAQEIFETLNARGAVLTAADLIKNFVFQRLIENGENVELAYEKYWSDFEQAFWEKEISLGKNKYPRSAVFLNHWLIAQTGEEIVAREVFARFKRYADFDTSRSMIDLVQQLHSAARVYRSFVKKGQPAPGAVDRLGLFAYRTNVMESEVIKPLVLHLLDPELRSVPDDQLTKALDVAESWMVRRMIAKVTTQSYTQVVAELIALLRQGQRAEAGEIVETYFSEQVAGNKYWPDDEEIRRQLETLPVYRRLSRARLRMVLEAIEDDLRGWSNGSAGLGGERVARGPYTIEHVMPQKWLRNWPLSADWPEQEREALINTLGNLTLLTQSLNSKVSNGPWSGVSSKRSGLKDHDVLFLNRPVVDDAGGNWTEERIEERTASLTQRILNIWPVPEDHSFEPDHEDEDAEESIQLVDLVEADFLAAGSTLSARPGSKFRGRTATLLRDGGIDVDGEVFESPSGAASAIAGTQRNGWKFFLLEPGRSLEDAWHEYVDQLDVDADDSELAGPDEDDDLDDPAVAEDGS